MRVGIWAIVILLLAPTSAIGQTITAFKTGEETTGMTKQCMYQALGNTYTTTIKSVQLCSLTIQVRSPVQRTQGYDSAAPVQPTTVTAFTTGERDTGMTKQCYYDALGSTYTRTIGSVELCPLSIQVRPGGY